MNVANAVASTLFPLLAGAALVCLLLGAVVILRKYPTLGVALIAATAVTSWELPSQPAIAAIAGVSIYYQDAVSVVFAVAALINFAGLLRNLGWTLFPVLVFLVVVGASLAGGAMAFGIATAANEARAFIASSAGLLWAASVSWQESDRNRFSGAIVWLSWALVFVAAYHAWRYGIGDSASIVNVDGLLQTNRVLIAPQALIVGIAGIWALLRWTSSRRSFDLASSLTFLIVVLVSQQRSAWAATAAGLAVAALVGTWATRRAALGAIAIGLLAVSIPLALSGTMGLGQGLIESLHDQVSYEHRTSSWDQLLTQLFASDVAKWFGFPFGSGYTRIEPNGLVQLYQPHNWYVSVLLRAGMIGFALFATFVIATIVRLVRLRQTRELAAVIMICVFWWAYGFDWFLAPIFGFSVAGVVKSSASARGALTPKSLVGDT